LSPNNCQKEKDPSLNFLEICLSRSATIPIQVWERLDCSEVFQILQQVFSLEDECNQKRSTLVDGLYAAVPHCSSASVRHKLLTLKRHIYGHVEPFTPDMLDIPPGEIPSWLWEGLKNFHDLLNRRDSLLKQAEKLFEKCLWRVRRNLLEILKDTFIQEGILLSSHDLWEAVLRYLENPPRPESTRKSHRQLERSVLAHLARTCTKTTPRGILTAVQLGKIDTNQTQPVSLSTESNGTRISRRKTVLSWPVVWDLARMIFAQGEVWRYIVPRVTPTLYKDGDGQWKFWRQEKKEEVLCKITFSVILEAFLKKAALRCLKANELIKQVQQEFPEYDLETLTNYYLQLTKSGLLIGHLEIPFTYFDGLSYLIQWVKDLPKGVLDSSIIADLQRIRELLNLIDEKK